MYRSSNKIQLRGGAGTQKRYQMNLTQETTTLPRRDIPKFPS